jgi:hypothetical protein
MPSFLELQCANILYQAAQAEIGLIIRTDNVIKARAALYRFRNSLNDPELAKLSIRVSPDDSEHQLWLLSNKNVVSLDLTKTEESELNA